MLGLDGLTTFVKRAQDMHRAGRLRLDIAILAATGRFVGRRLASPGASLGGELERGRRAGAQRAGRELHGAHA